MRTYILRRLLIGILVLWAVVTLVFFGSHLVPGDSILIGVNGVPPSAKQVAAMRHALGLDQPIPVQYWRYLVNLAHLDFGRSIRTGQPVWSEILDRWPTTLELAATAMVMSGVVGLITGVLAAAWNRTWLGTLVTGITVLGISVPDFFLGTILVLIFGVRLGWLPVSGVGDWRNLVLPSVTLAIGITAVLTRLIRTSLVDVLGMDYIRTARAKGLHKRRVMYKHALKNALIPVITIFGLTVANLLGGVVVIENVFNWPGLGSYAVSAVAARDFPDIEATTFVFAAILITANLLVDISYAFLDPRVRQS